MSERIFEKAPIDCRYGKREFVGYTTKELYPNGPSFILFEGRGKDVTQAKKELFTFLDHYINTAIGNIHWRQGPYFTNLKANEWSATARVLVHPYTPYVGPADCFIAEN